jgi:hypothetical protein
VARHESSKGVDFASFKTTPFAEPQSVPPKLKKRMALSLIAIHQPNPRTR